MYYIIDTETDRCIGSGTLEECMDFIQCSAFRGIIRYSIVDARTGEVVA